MTDNAQHPKLAFRPVNLDAHLDVCVRFAIDAQICAFGSAERFHTSDGKGTERYADWLRTKSTDLPGSVVHVWLGEDIIGQIEMGRAPEDLTVGYVSLFYLVHDMRGRGLGKLLEAYAWSFLSGLGCESLRLSATPTNTQARLFYERGGWQNSGPRKEAPHVCLFHKKASAEGAGLPVVINPDDYLETEFGREFTPERNRQAWQLAYTRLRHELSQAAKGTHVYVVMGVQGAGKSRWVSENLGRLGRRAIVFDAALPARRHRQELLSIARDYAVPVIGILVSAPLALARNAQRNADKKVPEDALKSVFSMLEPPSEDEGFVWVQTIEQQAPLPTTLQTARMSLVAPDVALAEKLADALNASYALHRRFLVWSKPHWTLEDTQESLQRAAKDFDAPVGEKRYFLLSRDDPQALVGCIGLLPLADEIHSFEVGYWGNQAHAGHGLMREALTALVLQLSGHTLRLTTSSANISSQRLAEAAGFEWVETLQGARRCEYFGVRDTLVYRRAAR
ncbi:GNAT family N-acetyltransferase [Pseudomonas yamanorum]|uniref:GNAT family N-acetyltransferase n=1 Tax=Pseudomonas yamanorum TaxID=515393 RepID=UPI003F752C15